MDQGLCSRSPRACILALSLELATNSVLQCFHRWFFQHHRICQIIWSKGKAACTRAWICCRVFPYSRPHSKLTNFHDTSIRAVFLDSGICCLPRPKKPTRHCTILPSLWRGTRCIDLSFASEEIFWDMPDPWGFKNFTEIAGSWIIRGCMVHLLGYMRVLYEGFQSACQSLLTLPNQNDVVTVMNKCDVLWNIQKVQISLDCINVR